MKEAGAIRAAVTTPTPSALDVDREEALLAHGDALLRYALTRVPDRATAEDLVQDVLVTAYGRPERFAEAQALGAWLRGILRHKIIDHHRWRARHPEAPAPGPDEAEDPWFTELGTWREDPNVGLERLDADPSQAVERAQLRLALRHCIEHLPRALHRVFVLRELEELEPEAVCEAAGISRDSLAVFLYRARQSLRSCLQQAWGEP
jgi:RNA polymerase sigma-70 factor (ECF subfamily)